MTPGAKALEASPPAPWTTRTRALVYLTATLAVLFTLIVSVFPVVSFAYRSIEAHVAIETAVGGVTALAAFLVYGRFVVSRSASDLVLTGGLMLFAASSILLSLMPPLLGADREGVLVTWAPVLARLAGTGALACAPFVGRGTVGRSDAGRLLVAVTVVAVAAIAVIVGLLASTLPAAIDPELSPERLRRPGVVGNAAVLTLQIVALALFTVATVGFVRRAERTGEELSTWLACASMLGAFAALNYFIFPSLHSAWLYTGDILRLGFLLVLCVGAAREIVRLQRALATAAVVEDRRRMARDIHDGLAQELAFIVTHSQRLVAPDARQGVLAEQIRDAAQRALDEARAAIEALTTRGGEPLDEVLCRAAENVAERYGARVRVQASPREIDVPAETRDALIRIVREAATNAVRHGRAGQLELEVSGPAPLVVRLVDDGAGFLPEAPGGGGFGLTSMRERVEALGGTLEVRSEPGHGAAVEVRLA